MQGVMKQVIFREDQVPALDDLASKLGVNRSVIVRWACDDLLQKNLSTISLERKISSSENAELVQPA